MFPARGRGGGAGGGGVKFLPIICRMKLRAWILTHSCLRPKMVPKLIFKIDYLIMVYIF